MSRLALPPAHRAGTTSTTSVTCAGSVGRPAPGALAERLGLDLAHAGSPALERQPPEAGPRPRPHVRPELLVLDEPDERSRPAGAAGVPRPALVSTGAGRHASCCPHTCSARSSGSRPGSGCCAPAWWSPSNGSRPCDAKSLHHVDGPVRRRRAGRATFTVGAGRPRRAPSRTACSAARAAVALDPVLKQVAHGPSSTSTCTEAELEETFIAYYAAWEDPMLHDVTLKTLYDQRRACPRGASASLLLVAMYVAVWPSIHGAALDARVPRLRCRRRSAPLRHVGCGHVDAGRLRPDRAALVPGSRSRSC